MLAADNVQTVVLPAADTSSPRRLPRNARRSDRVPDRVTGQAGRDYTGYESHRELRLSRRGQAGQASRLYHPGGAGLDQWALSGTGLWRTRPPREHSQRANRPATSTPATSTWSSASGNRTPIRFHVLLDGRPPGTAHGTTRRPWRRHRQRTAAVPPRPPARPPRRPQLRDHLPGPASRPTPSPFG